MLLFNISRLISQLCSYFASQLLWIVKKSFNCKIRMPGTVKCRPTVAYWVQIDGINIATELITRYYLNGTLIQCCFNARPTSATLAQHWTFQEPPNCDALLWCLSSVPVLVHIDTWKLLFRLRILICIIYQLVYINGLYWALFYLSYIIMIYAMQASKLFKMIIYADDTTLYSTLYVFGKYTLKKFNLELTKVANWLKLNKLWINNKKIQIHGIYICYKKYKSTYL